MYLPHPSIDGHVLPLENRHSFCRDSTLHLMVILGEEASCELSAPNTPGKWGNGLKGTSGQYSTESTTLNEWLNEWMFHFSFKLPWKSLGKKKKKSSSILWSFQTQQCWLPRIMLYIRHLHVRKNLWKCPSSSIYLFPGWENEDPKCVNNLPEVLQCSCDWAETSQVFFQLQKHRSKHTRISSDV